MNRAKNLPAISFHYDESCEKLEKFGKMPTFDEYLKSKIEGISTELKESFFDL